MAAAQLPLWSRENVDQQGLVRRCGQYAGLFERNLAELCNSVDVQCLWLYLRQLEVVDHQTQEELQGAGTRRDQVAALVEHLLKGPAWRFHGFLRALCLSNQTHVLSQILGLDPEVYALNEGGKGDKLDQNGESLEDGSKSRSHLPDDLQKAIKSHMDVYRKTLMKGHLFDIKELDMPYDMRNCYIQIVAVSDETLSEPVANLPDDILVVQPGEPELKSVLLSGPPGSGKSTFIRNFVYTRCAETPGRWDLIVILNITRVKSIPGKALKDKVMDAIRQSLEGSGEEVIMKNLSNEKLKVLLIQDGLDECRSKELLDVLTDLVHKAHTGKYTFTVLATCRSGLCPIKESFFDRRMKIEGFTLKQGLEYLKRFHQNTKRASTNSLFESVLSMANEGKLDHILTNPLWTHILSVVTADGTLNLKDGKTLVLKDLLEAIEVSMKKRQLEKETETEHDLGGGAKEIDIQDQTQKFYSMSLFALLNDIRVFDEDLFRRFEIHKENPYFTFMETRRLHNKTFENVTVWNFTHEMFLEYFAARALEALPEANLMCVLLVLCYKKQYRNTQKILFSILGSDANHLDTLTHMLRGTLILQSEEAVKLSKLADMKNKATYQVNVLDSMPHELVGAHFSKAKGIFKRSLHDRKLWDSITHFFEDKTETIRESGLLHAMLKDRHLMSHLYECICEVQEVFQQPLFESTFSCFLPSQIPGENGRVYSTGRMRWSEVIDKENTWLIHSSTPSEAQEAAQQHLHQSSDTDQQSRRTRLRSITLCIPCLEGRLGLPQPSADDVTSPRACLNLLQELSGPLQIRTGKLRIKCGFECKGLLDALMQEEGQFYLKKLLVKQDGGWRFVELWHGKIDSDDLCEWTKIYTKQNVLRIVLHSLTCYVNECDREMPAVREVNEMVHGESFLTSSMLITTRSHKREAWSPKRLLPRADRATNHEYRDIQEVKLEDSDDDRAVTWQEMGRPWSQDSGNSENQSDQEQDSICSCFIKLLCAPCRCIMQLLQMACRCITGPAHEKEPSESSRLLGEGTSTSQIQRV